MIGLYTDLVGRDVLTGETLIMALMFLNQFVKVMAIIQRLNSKCQAGS